MFIYLYMLKHLTFVFKCGIQKLYNKAFYLLYIYLFVTEVYHLYVRAQGVGCGKIGLYREIS